MDSKNTEKFDFLSLTDIRKEQFHALYRISSLLSAAEYSESLMADALDVIVGATHAERGLFAQWQVSSNEFNILAARNIAKEDISDLSAFSSGILGRVVVEKRPVLYHDVQSDPTLSQFKSVQIHKIKSVIGVPVFQDNQVWGVILVDSVENRTAFSEEYLDFLNFFSNMLSLALDRILQVESLRDENRALRSQLEAQQTIPDMVGNSPAIRQIANLVHRVAKTDATVLILGESGTGKDLVARAIHHLSPRKDKTFLAQFCGSIPETLLESELFGYKKGAFSGAHTDKKGLFEVVSGGTFFLDEIGDITPGLQAKLLRVLQNQEIIRVGDTQVRRVDVRIITATNQNLYEMVGNGRFRQDLFYRLNVFPITLPPLRERRTDISHLADHFLKKYSNRSLKIDRQTLSKLENYSWPGNVRQLENVIQRALILCDGERLLPEHIKLEEKQSIEDYSGTLRDVEKQLLLRRLKEFDNNRTQAAKSLGVSVRWIQLKLKELEDGQKESNAETV
ncbi:sigma 54-interacting transcriptional regulator [candidate division KSB1 bacterium]|nr:sigma 54-interacting transcriptional regulator [candidate division KSB1 bacterium]